MTIVQLITELYPAGAETVVLSLSKELRKRGHDVSVISLQPLPQKNTIIVDDLIASGIPVKTLNVTKFTPWRIFKLIKILKRYRLQTEDSRQKTVGGRQSPKTPPLVVHSHLIHANIVSRIASLFLNRKDMKFINTIHIAEKRMGKWWHFFLDKATFRLCDYQTAVSEAAQQHHAKKAGIPPTKIPVIYNGIVPPKQLDKKEISRLREEWGFKNCSRIIGSVGRLDWQKGYDIFFKMLPALTKKIPDGENWGVVILGEGDQKAYLERLAEPFLKSKNSKIMIALPGYRKDAADCIGAFDIFVMPSRYEGHPLTLLEAMGHGVPIIANNIPTITKVFEPYTNGTIVSFENKNTECIIENICNSTNNNHTKPYIPFSIEEMTKNYIQIYKSSL